MAPAQEPSYLVTGASGFLGRHLLQALQADARPRRALALVRDPQAFARAEWARKLDRVEVLAGSPLEPEGWRGDPRLETVCGVFHLAALVRHSRWRAEEVETSIVEGSRRVLELAAERGWRAVLVSTSGTVGCFRTAGESADEDSAPCEEAIRRWPYYRAKLRAEREARELADRLGLELVIARPPVLLGPGDHRFRSTGMLLRYLEGRLPFLIHGGVAFADVRDAARALVRAMEIASPRPVYHLPGTASSVRELFELAEGVCGVPAPRWLLPYRPAWWLARATERLGVWLRGEPFTWLPDPVVVEMASRWWGLRSLHAGRDLGYASRDPRETLADTLAWLREHRP